MIRLIAAALILSSALPGAPLEASARTGDGGGIACVSLACKDLDHYAPDAGFDPPIKYRCDDDDDWVSYLAEGESSWEEGCPDAGAVYVPKGQEFWRKDSISGDWDKVFDKTGWHGLGFWFEDGQGLTVRRD